jgi:hypothetical protein
VEFELDQAERAQEIPETLGQIRNREEGRTTRLERFTELRDFYNENEPYTVTNADRNQYTDLLDKLEDWEREALLRAAEDDDFVYFIDFENVGGLVMPLPLNITNADGSEEFLMLPAEIWRFNHRAVTKLMIRQQPIVAIEVDPRRETADVNYSNNHFPGRIEKSRIELYKEDPDKHDMMADMLATLRKTQDSDDESAKAVPLEPTGSN